MLTQFSNSRSAAFTLIELLIVVAIIAILAAIAVPNFLEAQVRAKVVRVKSDMRTTSFGLEVYASDHNTYPEEVAINGFVSTISLPRLTTPVAYLNSLECVMDIFSRQENQPFLYANYQQFGQNRSLGQTKVKAWAIDSFGPDKVLGRGSPNVGTGLFAPWAEANDSAYFNNGSGFATANDLIQDIYDPTNGTLSKGDIFRVGGACPPRSQSIMQ